MEGETLKNHVGQVGLVPTTWSKLGLQYSVRRASEPRQRKEWPESRIPCGMIECHNEVEAATMFVK